MPTLLWSTSTRSNRPTQSAIAASTAASSVTSAANAAATPPSATMRSTVSAADVRSRSTASTRAPSRANRSAVARPLPMVSPGVCPAPTTIATLSRNRTAARGVRTGRLSSSSGGSRTNARSRPLERMRFSSRTKPWPSSGKSTYSTGTPRRFRLSTTCSASTTGTLVSLAPWSTMVGAFTRSMAWIGDSSRSSSLLGDRVAVLDGRDRGHPRLGVGEEGLEVDDPEEIGAGGEADRGSA